MKFDFKCPKKYRVHKCFTRAIPNTDLYVWDVPNRRFALIEDVNPLNAKPWAVCKSFKVFKRLCRENPLVFTNGDTLKLLNEYEVSKSNIIHFLDATTCG